MKIRRGRVKYDQTPLIANLGFVRGGAMTRRKNSSRSRMDDMRGSVSMDSPVRIGSSRSGGTGGGRAVCSTCSSDSGAYGAGSFGAS